MVRMVAGDREKQESAPYMKVWMLIIFLIYLPDFSPQETAELIITLENLGSMYKSLEAEAY